MSLNNKFTERVKLLRLKKGLTQAELANEVGAMQNSYNRWERGKREPSFDNILQLADVLDTTTDYLLGKTNYNQTDWKQLREFEKPNLAKISKEELDTLKHSIAVELTQPIKKITPGEIVEYLSETWQLDDDEKSILTKIVDIVKKDWL